MNTAVIEVKRTVGRPKVENPKHVVAARVLPETKRQFNERARQEGTDMSSIIERLIETYLNEAH